MPKRKTNQEVIREFRMAHGHTYDYSNVMYKNDRSKVEIICSVHGSFFQTSNNHKRGQKCPMCKVEKQITRSHHQRLSTDTFIQNAKKVHGTKYTYDRTIYVNQLTKVEVSCPQHGTFWQRPGNHTQGQGCPKCNNSKGEQRIRSTLIHKGLKFKEQKKFNKCKHKRLLPFDFYLPNYNMLIEFDGKQHFDNQCLYNQNTDNLKRIQRNDQIKTEFAKACGYKLLRIHYTEINMVETIIEQELSDGC